MEILWIAAAFFTVIVGVTKFVEHVNHKEARRRAIKISRGE